MDINTASLEYLPHIPGIDEVSAQRIIIDRRRSGPIRSWAKLKQLAPNVNFTKIYSLHAEGEIESSIPIMSVDIDINDEWAIKILLAVDKVSEGCNATMIATIVTCAIRATKEVFKTELDTYKNEVDKSLAKHKLEIERSLDERILRIEALLSVAASVVGSPMSKPTTAAHVDMPNDVREFVDSHMESLKDDRVECSTDHKNKIEGGLTDNPTCTQGKDEANQYVVHSRNLDGMSYQHHDNSHDKESTPHSAGIAGFGHGQPQASPLDKETSKSIPQLESWVESTYKTPSHCSLGQSKDRTQCCNTEKYLNDYSTMEEPVPLVPLSHHGNVCNLHHQGSFRTGQVSQLAHSDHPLKQHDICQFCEGQGHNAKECPNIHTWSMSPLKCYNCHGKGHVARVCPSRLRDCFRPYRGQRWPPRVPRFDFHSMSPPWSDSRNWRSHPARELCGCFGSFSRSDSPNWRSHPTMGD